MDDMPANLVTWLQRYPEGLQALGATLKPLRGIMSRTMQTEGLDYSGAVDFLVNEYFALRYDDYVQTYEPQRGTTALDFCRIQFAYQVRRANEYSLRVTKAREARGRGTDTRDIEDIRLRDNDKALECNGCQVARAIAWERRKTELQALADTVDSLRGLEPNAAYIVWQHSALGVSYADLGLLLGMSAARVKSIYRGAMAELRR